MSRKIRNVKIAICLILPDNMKRNIDVFRFLVLLEIADEADGWLIVGEERSRVRLWIAEFVKKTELPK